MAQQSTKDNPETEPHKRAQPVINSGLTQSTAEAGYLSKQCWHNGTSKAKSEPQGKPHASHEGNSKWIIDENVN